MSYFENVYLPRVNRYGDNIQERIQGKREHDFITMMNKSPNKVEVREVDRETSSIEDYIGVLQTKEYDEDEVQDYLLVPCNREVAMGNLLYFRDVRHNDRKYPFLAFAEDPYTTAGYNRYTVVELEETLDWVVDGVPYTSPVHATGGGSGARDKNINLKFRVQFSEAGVYLPNKRYSLIMPYNEHIKKNHKVTLGGETWRVTGFDKISVKGVMYLTLEESLTDVNDDNPIANSNELENWTFTTNQGNNFEIGTENNWQVHCIYSYYKEDQINDIELELVPDEHLLITDIDIKAYRSGQYLSLNKVPSYVGPAKIDIKFKNSQKIVGTINCTCVNRSVVSNAPAILGPEDIYMESTAVYSLPNVNAAALTNAVIADETIAEIKKTDLSAKTITVKGLNIGTTLLSVPISDTFTLSKAISVQSIWLGGKDNVDQKQF